MSVPANPTNSRNTSSSRPPAGGTLLPGGAELDSARAALLEELARSLRASQQALLARDLAALELNTQTQNRLQRALEILWTQKAGTPRGGSRVEPEASDDAIALRLIAAKSRALQLGRVQAALLTRARRSLRTIVNLRTGLQATYVVPAASGVPGSRR